MGAVDGIMREELPTAELFLKVSKEPYQKRVRCMTRFISSKAALKRVCTIPVQSRLRFFAKPASLPALLRPVRPKATSTMFG